MMLLLFLGEYCYNHCDWKPRTKLSQLTEDSKLVLEKGKREKFPLCHTVEEKNSLLKQNRITCLISPLLINGMSTLVDEFLLQHRNSGAYASLSARASWCGPQKKNTHLFKKLQKILFKWLAKARLKS